MYLLLDGTACNHPDTVTVPKGTARVTVPKSHYFGIRCSLRLLHLMICQRLTPHLVDPVQVSPDFTLLSMFRCRLRWDPWHQGTRAPEPWALVPGIFFYFYFILAEVLFFSQKIEKNIIFSLFFLSFCLCFSLSLYTHFGFF